MAKPIPVVDLHEDIAYHYVTGGDGVTRPLSFDLDVEGRQADIPKYMRGGVKLVFSSIFPLMPTFNPRVSRIIWGKYRVAETICVNMPRSVKMNVLEQVKVYYRMAEAYPSIELIVSAESLREVFASDKIGFLISLEGGEALDDLDDLRLMYRLGIRSIQVTWNYDSKWAASCMSRKDYGLTGLGEDLVDEANSLGLILDISHASERTCIEVAEASKLPVIASHANVKPVHPHPRNLDDKVLEAIASSKGVVGFTMIPSTIAADPSVEHLADHILYVYEHYGSEIIGLGTDYFGLIYSKPPKGLEDISKIGRLWSKLLDKGLPKTALEALSYKNALRVLETHTSRWRSSF